MGELSPEHLLSMSVHVIGPASRVEGRKSKNGFSTVMLMTTFGGSRINTWITDLAMPTA